MPRLAPQSSALLAAAGKIVLVGALLGAVLATMPACSPVAVTMLGIGASVGISHHLNGFSSKTFVRTLPSVREASKAALAKMRFPVSAVEPYADGEIIRAGAADLNIEIQLIAMTPTATRMRVVARRDVGVIVDSATAQAITQATEEQLRATAVKVAN